MYQVIAIATHSETREEMVVYQALYGDYRFYVRPLDMFMSEVDRNKYPDVAQRYRFQKVEVFEEPAASVQPEVVTPKPEITAPKVSITPSEPVSEKAQIRQNFRNEPYKPSAVMEKSVDEEAQDLNLDPLVIKFLDADLAVEKNDILSKLRPIITNDMIDIMAMSLGVVVNEGDVNDRFNDLRTCLTTMEKYESTRLRS
ncbi:DUF1653 domain-containing protein [Butyrivibrio sp. X503]|uniref:DUF1653 domain-containing protein n=1 Tax=Butyrivibrio sp. X503 TaxID=2364878 RepID=UPI003FA494DF